MLKYKSMNRDEIESNLREVYRIINDIDDSELFYDKEGLLSAVECGYKAAGKMSRYQSIELEKHTELGQGVIGKLKKNGIETTEDMANGCRYDGLGKGSLSDIIKFLAKKVSPEITLGDTKC